MHLGDGDIVSLQVPLVTPAQVARESEGDVMRNE